MGGVISPSVHVAWFTAGSTGATGVHETAAKVTVKVAVVAEVSSHSSGNWSGQPTPAGSSVAVTVTDWPAEYGASGRTEYVILSVSANVSVGVETTPAAHTA